LDVDAPIDQSLPEPPPQQFLSHSNLYQFFGRGQHHIGNGYGINGWRGVGLDDGSRLQEDRVPGPDLTVDLAQAVLGRLACP
jgi:hypothetical protein